MKKFIAFIVMSLVVCIASAQVRTATTKVTNPGDTYVTYTGVAADTLTSNLDSIQFPIRMNHIDRVVKVSFCGQFSKRSGNDTSVNITLYGRTFADDSWTRITSTYSANVTTSTTFISASYGTGVMYREFRLNFRIAGMKSTGVKINYWQLKIFYQ